MRGFLKLSVVAVATLFTVGKASAQIDPHFSQYYVYPSWLNPALTGAFDGDHRVAGIYRSQWGNITSPFSTPGFALDFNGNKSLNYGVSVLQQSAGDGGYNYTTAYANVAYTGLRFGAMGYQRLVFGMQAGLIQRRFNPSKLSWGDQWNPITGYNPSNPTAEFLSRNAASSFDAGAGLLYYDAQPGKKTNWYGGFSVAHLTMPEDKFSATGKEKLPMRFTWHAGARIVVSETFSITPNALYVRQRSASETMLGAYGQIKANQETDVLVGLNYRLKDAVSPYVGFNYKNATLGISYDITTSDLSKLVRGANSFEISLSFIGKKKVKTPETEFICPRL
jgi:type IX secretion system PorP/SprF family membrane protein